MESQPETPTTKWYHQIWFILFLLFFVLGPLAIPLLWKSPQFPKWCKCLLTIAVVALTVWLILLIPSLFRDAFQIANQLYSS